MRVVRTVVSVGVAVAVGLGLATAAERSLSGTWCVEDEDLTITFLPNDSVRVASEDEDGVNGFGTFEKRDTIFVARIGDGDIAVEMGYRYDWKSDTVIEAQTLFMTVNGDSVNLPEGTVLMKRCAALDSSAAGQPQTDDSPKSRGDKKGRTDK